MGAFPSLGLRNDECWVVQGKTTPDHKTHSMGIYLCQDFKSSVTTKECVSWIHLLYKLCHILCKRILSKKCFHYKKCLELSECFCYNQILYFASIATCTVAMASCTDYDVPASPVVYERRTRMFIDHLFQPSGKSRADNFNYQNDTRWGMKYHLLYALLNKVKGWQEQNVSSINLIDQHDFICVYRSSAHIVLPCGQPEIRKMSVESVRGTLVQGRHFCFPCGQNECDTHGLV